MKATARGEGSISVSCRTFIRFLQSASGQIDAGTQEHTRASHGVTSSECAQAGKEKRAASVGPAATQGDSRRLSDGGATLPKVHRRRRAEERRVGKGGVSTGRLRWVRVHEKKKT